LAARLADLVDATIGKPFRPERVVFVRELPRTRSAKIVRRAIRAVVRGEDPGDLSSLENPDALAVIWSALAPK
jgi:acetyl-CoA synthetase